MSTAPHPAAPVLPRGLLVALGATVLVTVIGVATVRLGGVSVRAPDAPSAATRLLRFEDSADGSVVVIDAASGRALDTLRGEQGFVRGALRALSRERRIREIGPLPPFELASRTDGRLTLSDPATGARIDLESFGPTNAGVFARLLTLTEKN